MGPTNQAQCPACPTPAGTHLSPGLGLRTGAEEGVGEETSPFLRPCGSRTTDPLTPSLPHSAEHCLGTEPSSRTEGTGRQVSAGDRCSCTERGIPRRGSGSHTDVLERTSQAAGAGSAKALRLGHAWGAQGPRGGHEAEAEGARGERTDEVTGPDHGLMGRRCETRGGRAAPEQNAGPACLTSLTPTAELTIEAQRLDGHAELTQTHHSPGR